MERYLRFIAAGAPAEGWYGKLENEEMVRLLDGSPLAGGKPLTRSLPLAEIERFLPPVVPPNIIALGRNYAEHAREQGVDVPSAPVVFLKATSALIGHGDTIILPREHAHEVDYEAELAVVIGRRARRVQRSEALSYVFGYTCANDISARDCQLRLDKQWARGKSFDTFCPLGPFLCAGINIGCWRICLRLNGRIMQDQSTADMLYDVPAIIEYLSAAMTLLPGTVILTGTPGGVGHARRPPVFLRPGDRVEVEIEPLGILVNNVANEV